MDTDNRPLTAGEIKLARRIFGNSLDYDKIRIANRRIMKFQPEHGGLCTGNTINISGRAYADDYSQMQSFNLQSFFIHEMTHMWQFQKSPLYFGKKFMKEILSHRFNYMAKAYQYTLENGKSFDDYGLEQQACMVQDYFAWSINQGSGQSHKCQNKDLKTEERIVILKEILRPYFNIEDCSSTPVKKPNAPKR